MKKIVPGMILTLLLACMLPLNTVRASPLSVTLRPNANGTYELWSVSGGERTRSWDAIDDVTPDEDSTYIMAWTPDSRSTFQLPDIPSDASVTFVDIYVRARGGMYTSWDSYGRINIMWRLHGADTLSITFTLGPDYTAYSSGYYVSWTGSDVNDLEVGVRHAGSSVSEPIVTQIYVVVTYEPSTLASDLNKDGKVNLQDIYIVAKAYSSHGPDIPKIGDSPSKNWNAIADLNKDGWVNLQDMYKVARDYGKPV